jgi:multidrug resistance efflux pump
MEKKENLNRRKNWWKTRNAIISMTIITILFGLGFIFWFLTIMPYVSTEDARVDTNIVRIANLGASGQIVAVNFKEGDKITINMH